MTGERGSALDLARGRLVIVSACFIVAFVIIGARAFDLSFIQGELHQEMDIAQAHDTAREQTRRLDIVDRSGILLARSLKTASLYADPAMIENPSEVARALAETFPAL